MADSQIPSYLAPNAAPAPASTPHADVADGQPFETVLDVANGTTLNIPKSEFEIAVRSGQYAPTADKNYVVRDANNELHSVQGSNLNKVLAANHTIASDEEAAPFLAQQKYGSSPVLAGVEGFQRGALPGVADRLLEGNKDFNGDAITQEDLAGRAEANPIAAGAGELVGTFFSPLTKAIGIAGKGAEAATAKVLTKVAAKSGLTNKVAQAIVAKIAPAAAGSAVEGAFYGATHLLNEDALGTADFNAENLLASTESGALWGAAFGGAFSATGLAAKAAYNSAPSKYVRDAVGEVGAKLNNSTKAAREFLGITPSRAQKLEAKDPEFMDDAIAWTKEVLNENPKATIGDVAAKAVADKEVIGKKIGDVYKNVDDAAAKLNLNVSPTKADVKFKIAQEIEERVLPKFKDVEGMGSDIKSINKTINEVLDSAGSADGKYTAEELHRVMRDVQDKINFDKPLTGTTLKQEMLKVQREVIRKELDGIVKSAETQSPSLAGSTEALKAANRRFRTISSLEKSVSGRADVVANSGTFSKLEMLAGAAGGAEGVAGVVGKKFLESDMLRKMQILGKIEKAQLATTKAINSGLTAVGNGVKAIEPVVLKALVDSQIATKLENGKKIKPRNDQEAYQNIIANAQFASENPEQFLKGVNRYSSHLYAVAPKTSGALDTAALNAMVYLHSKVPKSTKNPGFFDSGKHSRASGADMLKMQQRVQMIEQPAKAFELLKKNKLGATHVETLKTVYPSMYAQMQQSTMSFLSSPKAAKLTYSQKLNMATLLDIQADESTHYSNVIGLQSNFANVPMAGSEEPNGGVVNSTQGGLGKVNIASRMDLDNNEDS